MDWNDQLGRLRLRDLHILQTVAESGSMAKAAASLRLSQPAVSQVIAQMERALGMPLLDRTPRGTSPTVYGDLLLKSSIVAFNELRQGLKDMEFLADPAAGELRIGTTPPMSVIASTVINHLVRLYPRMAFHLINDGTTGLLRELRQRNIEVAVTRLVDPLADEDLDVRILFDVQLAVIAGRHNPWARRRGLTLADLQGEPWALPPPGSFLGVLIDHAFVAQGLEAPRRTVSTTSSYALAVLAANGPFLTIHPGTMLRFPKQHPSLTALSVDLAGVRNPVGLITLKHRTQSAVARIFTDTALEVVRSLRGNGQLRGQLAK